MSADKLEQVEQWAISDEESVDHSRAVDEPKSIPTGCSKPCSLCSGAHSWFFRPFLTDISPVSADAV